MPHRVNFSVVISFQFYYRFIILKTKFYCYYKTFLDKAKKNIIREVQKKK